MGCIGLLRIVLFYSNNTIRSFPADFLFLQGCVKNLLLGRDQNLGAAHVGPQDLGNLHGAVRLKVVFQEGDQHTGRCHAGVVQRVAELHLAVFILVADAQTAGLGVTQVGAGAHLKVLLLTGGPGLNVAGLHLQVGQIAGAALQLPHGDVHGAEQLTEKFHSLSYHALESSGLQTTIISCFSNWWMRYTPRSSMP